jgi:hypothetical protein
MKEELDFDDFFEDGVYAIPRPPGEPRVKVRALYEYCKEKGITPDQLNEDEMEQFLVRDEIKRP